MEKHDFTILSQDKKNLLHVTCWQGDTPPIAALQITHGMVEYIHRYHDFATYLTNHGIAVIGHDHLGHGLTAKTPEDLGFFHETDGKNLLIQDMYQLTKEMKKRFPNIPHFLLGHSMGSFCARKYLTLYGKELDGAILMGVGEFPSLLPFFGKKVANFIIARKGGRFVSPLLVRLTFLGYMKGIKNPKTTKDWITRDEEIVQNYITHPHTSFCFTTAAFRDLFSIISYDSNKIRLGHIPKNLPLLITAGEADPVGQWGKSPRKLYHLYQKEGFTDVTLHLYPDCRHEILNELNRQEVYGDILKWLLTKM